MREPLRATFFALRWRGRFGVLLGAAIAYTILAALLFCAAFFAFSWATGTVLLAAQPAAPPAPDFGRMLWLFPLALLFGFFYALLMASYEAGCLRWFIRGEVRGLLGLTVDDDTWRVYGAYWVWFGIYIAWALAYWIVHALLTRLLGAEHWGVWLGAGLLGLMALVSIVSLAPATAATIAKRRFAFFEATQASEERFLPLLGSYALIVGGQWLIQQGMTLGWWTWALGSDWIDAFRGVSDYTSLVQAQILVSGQAVEAAGSAAVSWLISGVTFALSLLGMVLLFGVNARAVLLAIDEGRIQPDPADREQG